MSELTPRAVCYRCDKPAALCVCARVPRVENRTGVLVLQHPRERLHPIGTARFARLGLTNVRVEVAWNANAREDAIPKWVPKDTALLYPAPNAPDLASLPCDERPKHLLVVDGTWHTARTLRRDKTWLERLRTVRLAPAAPSRYRLRLEPFADCLSTIEAIVGALAVLEPETPGLDKLLAAFGSMIDDQLAFVLRSSGTRHKRTRRPPAERRLPVAIVEGFSRIVIAYAESCRDDPSAPRSLVQVSALGLATRELKQWICVPRARAPGPILLGHMQLEASDFEAAVEPARFLHEWLAFVNAQAAGPAIVAAWNQSTLDLLHDAGAALPEQLVLKSAYRARKGTLHPSLDDVVRGEGIALASVRARGRAAQRVASAEAIARYLNALAQLDDESAGP